jgi:membrane fusion protein (multidrug efflux system)
MRKFVIIGIIVVVLLVATFLRISASMRKKQLEEQVQEVPVEVIEAQRGAVVSTCEIIGTINANKTAQVFPETMGRITRILVKEGTYVSKNSNLMALKNETIGFEYEEGYIRSPIGGNVAKIMVDAGTMVTPQTPVAMVVEYSTVKVTFNMSENAGQCVARGSKVGIDVDAFPDTSFTGKVSEVSPVIDPYTRTVAVKAIVANPKKLLKPGMTARVTLTMGEKTDVVAIPKDALLDGFLFVVTDSTAERRDVEVGLFGDKTVEIISGVTVGEKVVIVGQQRLAGGEKVSIALRGE